MDRLPFDPTRIRGDINSDAPGDPSGDHSHDTGPEDRPLTVSALAGLIKATLERRIPSPIHVVGQVSNLARPNHWYFSLKDEQSVVSCVAWASTARKLGFVPDDGDEVLATGHVSHYAPQGRTQFYVSSLRPVGAGALQQRFEAMCAELRALGYFEEERKKTLPTFPRRIAVITSAGGAAIHDVVSTAGQRCAAVSLLLVDVRVQGDGAAQDVARAIRYVDTHHARLGVDAIIVTRGGGSMEDLWAFNERVVADAAFQCSIPLVAAVGHESDTTVIELVADLRAATPTQAAMRLVPSAEELDRQIEHLSDRLTVVTRGRITAERVRIERWATRLAMLRPERLLAARSERLALLAQRLRRATRFRIDQRPRIATLRERLDRAMGERVRRARSHHVALGRELDAVDPRRVLGRGFSYTTGGDGGLVRSVADVGGGDALVTHVADGTIESVVEGTRGRDPSASRKRPARSPERDAPADATADAPVDDSSGSSFEDSPGRADQMDLFGSGE